jgi:hypothetical protein
MQREKNKRKYDKLKEHTTKAKLKLTKRQGTYRKDINLDDPIEQLINGDQDDEEGFDPVGEKPPAKKQKKTTSFCEYCGIKGAFNQ